jgi:hypothetical protein
MRRILGCALGVGSAPVGVLVGLWMALLTQTPACPVRGLGTAALCAGRPLFAPGLCVVGGGVAAAVVLLLSIVAFRPASRVAIFDLAAAEAGILVGLWTSTLFLASPCGPRTLCLDVLAQRFAGWESALIGAAVMVLMVMLGAAANPAWRRANLDVGRSVRAWLFNDLSRSNAR